MNVRAACSIPVIAVSLGALACLAGCASNAPLGGARGDAGPFLLDRPADTRGSDDPREIEGGDGRGFFPFNLFGANDT